MAPLAWWTLVFVKFLQSPVLKVGCSPEIQSRGWGLAGGGEVIVVCARLYLLPSAYWLPRGESLPLHSLLLGWDAVLAEAQRQQVTMEETIRQVNLPGLLQQREASRHREKAGKTAVRHG